MSERINPQSNENPRNDPHPSTEMLTLKMLDRLKTDHAARMQSEEEKMSNLLAMTTDALRAEAADHEVLILATEFLLVGKQKDRVEAINPDEFEALDDDIRSTETKIASAKSELRLVRAAITSKDAFDKSQRQTPLGTAEVIQELDRRAELKYLAKQAAINRYSAELEQKLAGFDDELTELAAMRRRLGADEYVSDVIVGGDPGPQSVAMDELRDVKTNSSSSQAVHPETQFITVRADNGEEIRVDQTTFADPRLKEQLRDIRTDKRHDRNSTDDIPEYTDEQKKLLEDDATRAFFEAIVADRKRRGQARMSLRDIHENILFAAKHKNESLPVSPVAQDALFDSESPTEQIPSTQPSTGESTIATSLEGSENAMQEEVAVETGPIEPVNEAGEDVSIDASKLRADIAARVASDLVNSAPKKKLVSLSQTYGVAKEFVVHHLPEDPTKRKRMLTFVGGAGALALAASIFGVAVTNNDSEPNANHVAALPKKAVEIVVDGIEYPGQCFIEGQSAEPSIIGDLSGSAQMTFKEPGDSSLYYDTEKSPQVVSIEHRSVGVNSCATDKDVLTIEGTKITIDRSKSEPQMIAGNNGEVMMGPITVDSIKQLPIEDADKQWLTGLLQGESYSRIVHNVGTAVLLAASKDETYVTELHKTIDQLNKSGVQAQVEGYAKKAGLNPADVTVDLVGEYPDAGVYQQFIDDKNAKVNPDTAKVKLKLAKGDKPDEKFIKFNVNDKAKTVKE
ncbi:MAG: hypothetical protein ABIR91_03530 [Candidatus Saccharimonadales bacterium]